MAGFLISPYKQLFDPYYLLMQFLLFANAGFFLQLTSSRLTNNFLTYAFLFGRHADLDLTICKKPLYLDLQPNKGGTK